MGGNVIGTPGRAGGSNVNSTACGGAQGAPRVVVIGLASCFGCQLQITNQERYLLDVLGQIDLQYWQLASSDPMPESFDVVVIEGAVTNVEAEETLCRVREAAGTVIAIGACATTAGIPGMAAKNVSEHAASVYGESVPHACGELVSPKPVSAVIPVDYEVRCCPIDFYDFVSVLHRVLYGSNRSIPTSTLCGECKRNETGCFYAQGTMCLGLVTRSGCGARCVNLGRPCNGCAGLSPDANLDQARATCRAVGVSVQEFDQALEMFNQVDPAFAR